MEKHSKLEAERNYQVTIWKNFNMLDCPDDVDDNEGNYGEIIFGNVYLEEEEDKEEIDEEDKKLDPAEFTGEIECELFPESELIYFDELIFPTGEVIQGGEIEFKFEFRFQFNFGIGLILDYNYYYLRKLNDVGCNGLFQLFNEDAELELEILPGFELLIEEVNVIVEELEDYLMANDYTYGYYYCQLNLKQNQTVTALGIHADFHQDLDSSLSLSLIQKFIQTRVVVYYFIVGFIFTVIGAV
ncbi:MAG: hypothetical protein EZS28_048318 [Streblomastix strix]|uniref:Uncharacterized protein n=1 Tax=Streblomastix strix TaxID=222440 RepID=A0A5J4TF89_9EUKA|nr:MAG: hypothetical protein EZS28_048318 [Streblomastix strix]